MWQVAQLARAPRGYRPRLDLRCEPLLLERAAHRLFGDAGVNALSAQVLHEPRRPAAAPGSHRGIFLISFRPRSSRACPRRASTRNAARQAASMSASSRSRASTAAGISRPRSSRSDASESPGSDANRPRSTTTSRYPDWRGSGARPVRIGTGGYSSGEAASSSAATGAGFTPRCSLTLASTSIARSGWSFR